MFGVLGAVVPYVWNFPAPSRSSTLWEKPAGPETTLKLTGNPNWPQRCALSEVVSPQVSQA